MLSAVEARFIATAISNFLSCGKGRLCVSLAAFGIAGVAITCTSGINAYPLCRAKVRLTYLLAKSPVSALTYAVAIHTAYSSKMNQIPAKNETYGLANPTHGAANGTLGIADAILGIAE